MTIKPGLAGLSKPQMLPGPAPSRPHPRNKVLPLPYSKGVTNLGPLATERDSRLKVDLDGVRFGEAKRFTTSAQANVSTVPVGSGLYCLLEDATVVGERGLYTAPSP
jgi:hypothetical protein